jgi:hypothetical protein
MMSRYASSAPVRDDLPARAQERPTHCEVTGCRSLFVGRNNSGVEIFKRGKADIFLDVDGRLRGVCCKCYACVVDAAGLSRMSGLTDGTGALDFAKVHAHMATQEEIPQLAKMTRPPAADEDFFATHQRDRSYP